MNTMVQCPKCGYHWRPRTSSPMLCCPQCLRKFKRPDTVISVLGRSVPLSTTCDGCGMAHRDLHVVRIDEETAVVCGSCLASLIESGGVVRENAS